jgi:hypothetical protein
MGFESIDIGQALHGYSEGHRLLASSNELSRDAQRTMLVLSDMSGPSMQKGFEQYVTGYPLPNSDCYAFSKTWYAPEMSRPGCVWTHTLILSPQTLGSILDLRLLLPLFRRPSKGNLDFASYSVPIQIPQILPSNEFLEFADHPLLPVLLAELYGHEKDYPIALAFNEPSVLEDIIIAIWSQQWPSLRQRFTFCSGAMSVRSVNGIAFDFQVVPPNQCRQFERDVKELRLVENRPLNEFEYDWVSILVYDLRERFDTSLRNFLQCFGGNARCLLSRLTILHERFRFLQTSNSQGSDVISTFFALFPNANEHCPELVQSILGRRLGKKESSLLGTSEQEMLFCLALHRDKITLNPQYLNANSRAHQLWHDDRLQAIRLMSRLIDNRITPVGKEILKGFARAMTPHDLFDISQKHKDLLFVIASLAPALAAMPDIWRIEYTAQLTLLDAISVNSLTANERGLLLSAIIEAGSSSIGEEALSQFGDQFIESLLESIENKGYIPGNRSEWSKVLTDKPEITIRWLKNHNVIRPKTFAFAAIALDPRDKSVKQQGVEFWAQLLRPIEHDLDQQDVIDLSCFLMPLALMNSGPDAGYLARFAFPYIHDALAKNQLEWRTWRTLDPLLPEIPWHWFRSWDKCERLRMAMEKKGFQPV